MSKQPNFIQQFGFSEMYEWAKIPNQKLGLFVQFNKKYPDLIEPYHDKNGALVGVSTICSTIDSDDPEEWKYAYMYNNVGDSYLKKEQLAIGLKQYDQNIELSYISTRPYEHYIKIENKAYNKDLKYVKRSLRADWVRVNMLGKVIVIDNGKCIPGNYCTPYTGDNPQMFGTAIPWEGEGPGFYIMNRVTDNTILIVNNSLLNL